MTIAAKMTVAPRRFLGFCEDVSDYTTGLDEGVEVFGFTSGEFSLIDILSALVERMDSPAVTVSTWTAAKAAMDHVHAFLERGAVSTMRWIVDRSFQNRQPDLCTRLRTRFGDDAIRVQRVHCKFLLLADAHRCVTVQTSANLNRNARIENVSVSSCPVFFGAYAHLVESIFDTQVAGAGFEASSVVTAAFKEVAKKPAKSKRVPSPWHEPTLFGTT